MALAMPRLRARLHLPAAQAHDSEARSRTMSKLEIHQFPCLDDNYGVLVHDPDTGSTASIDAPEVDAVRAALAEKGWRLTHILVTHHHHDHTGGVLELKGETGCTVIGPAKEADRIPGLDRGVGEGDTFALGSAQVHVIDTPGHTAGHVSYWIPAGATAFVGDTMFAMGCGRVFEGTYETMWASLSKLKRLPAATRIYCGHEYTAQNGRFGLAIEPGNAALEARMSEVEALRAAGKPTLPTRLDRELETNVFLRTRSPEIRSRLGLATAEDWQVFAALREKKNKA